ncbi:uncharacterized protein EV422DRAFT_207427 [Fimicolochytrium jonesii]|uniref:uncharacterized protein n=1 Tax=Fimicolochytrium jonesii TaxID=1396493 RepID=UPI0022FF0AB7|nr:uncharacterized protein EV422DRAFT_207427 [Fimicolochytrium jonesii]KAI8817836.1 hypothetical protein EV422DRAFT_207427 [Fimicolochytrium jonesii]
MRSISTALSLPSSAVMSGVWCDGVIASMIPGVYVLYTHIIHIPASLPDPPLLPHILRSRTPTDPFDRVSARAPRRRFSAETFRGRSAPPPTSPPDGCCVGRRTDNPRPEDVKLNAHNAIEGRWRDSPESITSMGHRLLGILFAANNLDPTTFTGLGGAGRIHGRRFPGTVPMTLFVEL